MPLILRRIASSGIVWRQQQQQYQRAFHRAVVGSSNCRFNSNSNSNNNSSLSCVSSAMSSSSSSSCVLFTANHTQRREMHSTATTLANGAGGSKVFGSFHFGTTEYASCFHDLPKPDPLEFRKQALDYLDNKFQKVQWYKDPICSILKGVPLLDGWKLDDNDNDNTKDVVVDAATGRTTVTTYSGLGDKNGKQVFCNKSELEAIANHIRSFQSPYTDCRDVIRSVEEDLLTNYAGELIGAQCLDFGKQDGVTELIEMVQACVVERRLNDYLVLEEKLGHVTVNRQPIYVTIVSNFTNFLDLSKKTLRSLELGIPVVILGRTNHTQQHGYRWAQLLIELCRKQKDWDPGMITFVSCDLDDLKSLLGSCPVGNLYMTGSRDLARAIKSIYPNTISSTGGPNTMVLCTPVQSNPVDPNLLMQQQQQQQQQQAAATGATDAAAPSKLELENPNKEASIKEWFTPQLKKAIQLSACIESSGQCTALRHVVVPPEFTEEDVAGVLASAPMVQSPLDSLRAGTCDGVFATPTTPSSEPPPPTLPPPVAPEYHSDTKTGKSTHWKLSEELPNTKTLNEYWRQVVVDYTKLETSPDDKNVQLDKLAHWLNTTQPISLAVNGNMSDAYRTMSRLFERTSLAVYTVGGIHQEVIPSNAISFTSVPKVMPPALSCQARPQEAEIFGEVPPRTQLHHYSKYPVYVPSSNPSYDTNYTLTYLLEQQKQAADDKGMVHWNESSKALWNAITNPLIQGYCTLLVEYLRNVDEDNPKHVKETTDANRTVLWGLQRPPLQSITVLRVPPATTATSEDWFDACAPAVLLFHVTNARDQFQLSIPAEQDKEAIARQESFCQTHQLAYLVETDEALQERMAQDAAAPGLLQTKQPVPTKSIFQVVQQQIATPMTEFPMVGQYTSLFFPMGHIKSTAPQDMEFVNRMKDMSRKWIQTLF